MIELRFTLLADGPSDDALLPIITWLLGQHLTEVPVQSQWADLRHLRARPRGPQERIREALNLYPCDLLFVHRDAEREPPEHRLEEVRRAIEAIPERPPYVCVVPVRMTEAWLLFDEPALRRAAGNPNGRMSLQLPPLAAVEALPDPKQILQGVLREASGLGGRRLKNFHVSPRRVVSLIDDFSALRGVPAFNRMEREVEGVLADRARWT